MFAAGVFGPHLVRKTSKAASTMDRVRSSSPGHRWLYTRSVIAAFA